MGRLKEAKKEKRKKGRIRDFYPLLLPPSSPQDMTGFLLKIYAPISHSFLQNSRF